MTGRNNQSTPQNHQPTSSAAQLRDKLWQEVKDVATNVGLDPKKFTKTHERVIQDIADFLIADQQRAAAGQSTTGLTSLRQRIPLLGRLFNAEPKKPAVEPLNPIFIYGEPGTGKTTFLYVLDYVLRTTFNLPDNLRPEMKKKGNQVYPVHKRTFSGIQTSLLSVKKWAELLHFYAWDTDKHRLVQEDVSDFIQTTLYPMRIIFADEVEMAGYSPTIPNLAQHGILVVGSSNQSQFNQLVDEGLPPKLYEFSGLDMRAGDPMDAVVTELDETWQLYATLTAQPEHRFEQLQYHYLNKEEIVYVRLDFKQSVLAPFLETKWIEFLQTTYQQATDQTGPLQSNSPYILLFDGFSLEVLRTDYNAIIRFISLFDAIEQLGIGVFVRNVAQMPTLSREALQHMKVTIQSTPGVSQDIKKKTIVGIDRCASRIGQAGHRAVHRSAPLGRVAVYFYMPHYNLLHP